MGLRERLGRQHSVHSAAASESQPSPGSGSVSGRSLRSVERSRLGIAVDNVRSRFVAGTTRPRVQPLRHRASESQVYPESSEPLETMPRDDADEEGSVDSDGNVTGSHPAHVAAPPENTSNPMLVYDAAGPHFMNAPSGAAPRTSSGSTGVRYGHESLLPTICRRPEHSTPILAEEHEHYYGGAALSDDKIAFTVPHGWRAILYRDGFRLSNGPCVGFVRATASADASAALCDTSELTLLDTFDVASSPIVDAQTDVFALVVEYRNHGAGRGVAIFEPGNDAGAAVFGFSGPARYADVLEDAEGELLCGAYVLAAPLPLASRDHQREPPSPEEATKAESADYACAIV